jgi:hypothetical protein
MKEFEDDQQSKTNQNNGEQMNADNGKWSDVAETDPIESLSLADRKLMLARLRFEEVTEKLSKVVVLAQEAERDPNRSPSPEPLYNQDGIRTNTREVRMRTRFQEQKKQLLDDMLRLKPIMSSRGQVEAPGPKQIQRKIYIPVKDFPGRNFIGLIIGPRGNTQKRLEGETGCKIAIRGKGSVKAGRQGKVEDEADELHVIVTGDTEANVDLAADKVEELLRPLDDQDNTHKQQQLRELAIYNGTFRDHETCHHCQEKGHKQWECPKKRAADAAAAAAAPMAAGRGRGWNGPVVCQHCGERSHPSADCPTLRIHPPMPQRGAPGVDIPQYQPPEIPSAPGVPAVDQSEFMDFWQEVSAPTNAAPGMPMYNQAQAYPVQSPTQQYSHYTPPQSVPAQQQYQYPPQYTQPSAYVQPPQQPTYPPAPYYPAPPQAPSFPEPPPKRY